MKARTWNAVKNDKKANLTSEILKRNLLYKEDPSEVHLGVIYVYYMSYQQFEPSTEERTALLERLQPALKAVLLKYSNTPVEQAVQEIMYPDTALLETLEPAVKAVLFKYLHPEE